MSKTIGKVTPLGSKKKIWYPCGCSAYLELGAFPSIDLCDEHHRAVFGCDYFDGDKPMKGKL